MNRYTVGQVVGTVDCHYCGKTHVAEFSHYSQYGENMPVFSVICFKAETGVWVTDHYTTDAIKFDTYVCQGCGKEVVTQHQPSHMDVCMGEEMVNEMTNTGDATDNDVRDIFPRVTFRDAQDAEMVAESLRSSVIGMGKKAANVVQVWNAQRALSTVGVQALVLDGKNEPADAVAVVKELVTGMTTMLEMLEIIAAQLGVMYVPTEENGKYITGILTFASETRVFMDALAMFSDVLNEAGE